MLKQIDYSPAIMNHYRNDRKNPFRAKDALYLLVYTLIVVGLVHRVELKLRAPVSNLIAKSEKAISAQAKEPVAPKVVYVKDDVRVERLSKYLLKYNSPLAADAQYIIEVSDEHAIDWTLIVSIAGKESTLGTKAREICHNPFGLMGKDGLMCFASWREAILFEAELLSSHYRDNMIGGIQPNYCPTAECNESWTKDVMWFANDILAKE